MRKTVALTLAGIGLFPRDTIVAGLEVGGEAFSREELFLFVLLEGDSLRVALLQAA